MNDATLRIWVGTYNAYNDGKLKGEWIELPCDEDELNKALERISGDIPEYEDAEYMINDYESDELENLEVGESENIHKLNEFMERVQCLKEMELKAFNCYLENSYDKEEALEIAESDEYYFLEAKNYQELGETYIDEVYGSISGLDQSTLESYFDYEAFGRSIAKDAYQTEDGFFFPW